MIRIDCVSKGMRIIRPGGKKYYTHHHIPSCFADAINKCEIDEHIEIMQFNGKIKTFKRVKNLNSKE